MRLTLFLLLIMAAAFSFNTYNKMEMSALQYEEKWQSLKFKPPKEGDVVQKRESVTKQLLFQRENERLCWRLESKDSILTLLKSERGSGVVEQFHNIKALLEENSLDGVPLYCHIEAPFASLFWNKQSLLLNEASFKRYKANEAPLLEGIAQEVFCRFDRELKTPDVEAKNISILYNDL